MGEIDRQRGAGAGIAVRSAGAEPDHGRRQREQFRSNLQAIQGRSIIDGGNAFCVFSYGVGYIQFLSDPWGHVYRCEIGSHKYVPEIEGCLTESTFFFLQEAGFEWPKGPRIGTVPLIARWRPTRPSIGIPISSASLARSPASRLKVGLDVIARACTPAARIAANADG